MRNTSVHPGAAERWLPPALLLGLVLVAVAMLPLPQWYHVLIVSERGIIENGTVAIALVGAVYAWLLFRYWQSASERLTSLWYLGFVLGLVLLAGEEISWGQQWFGWKTPGEFAKLNIQQETNLHNLSGWSEQVPKILMAGGILTTGVLWPLYKARRPDADRLLGDGLRRIWPPETLWPSAVIAFALYLIGRVLIGLDLDDDLIRPYVVPLKEGHELFLILYVTLYLRSAWCTTPAARATEREVPLSGTKLRLQMTGGIQIGQRRSAPLHRRPQAPRSRQVGVREEARRK